MMGLTGKQILLIVAAVLSAMVAASAQLTDIFGPTAAKAIISAVSLANTILTSIIAAMSGQGSIVRDVAAMPGVSKIEINAAANQSLAQVAMDPDVSKVAASAAAASTVAATAKGT